jgi:Protein of unknown function (DUF3309)
VSIGTIILIILVIALLGGFSGIGGGPFYGTGYYGGGGLGLVIIILLILLLLGRLYAPLALHSGARAKRGSPESITPAGSMDSGPAPRGASRNDVFRSFSQVS